MEKTDRENRRHSSRRRPGHPDAARRPAPAETTGTSRKQFMLLEGAPILVHTVRKFVASPLVTDIVVAVREEDIEWVEEMLHTEARGLLGALRVVAGGNTRQESVENAFARSGSGHRIWWRYTMRCGRSSNWKRFDKVIEEAAATGAAIVGIVPGGHREAGERRAGGRREGARDDFARAAGAGADSPGVPPRYAAARL